MATSALDNVLIYLRNFSFPWRFNSSLRDGSAHICFSTLMFVVKLSFLNFLQHSLLKTDADTYQFLSSHTFATFHELFEESIHHVKQKVWMQVFCLTRRNIVV